jgi:hypothetical protein
LNKQHILDEIRRTAAKNGGVPLGIDRFASETGIKASDWIGRFWARWGDAILEAGARWSRVLSCGILPESTWEFVRA